MVEGIRPNATERTIAWAAGVVRADLGNKTAATIPLPGRRALSVELRQDIDSLMIWINRREVTEKFIVAYVGCSQLSDGTPAQPARISAQDWKKGTIQDTGYAPIRKLRRAIRSAFPNVEPKPFDRSRG